MGFWKWCPKIKLSLEYLTVVSTPVSWNHLRGPIRFKIDGMRSGVTKQRSGRIMNQTYPF